MKIYLDILLLTNFLATFVCITLFKRLVHIRCSKKRTTAASLVGAVSALAIIIVPESFFESLLITLFKLIIASTTVAIITTVRNPRDMLRYFSVYITVNVIFDGICLLLWDVFHGRLIYIKNCTVYFDVPLYVLFICIIAAYILISLYERIISVKGVQMHSYKAELSIGDISITLPAVCDSGNLLTDSFSGEPVVVFVSSRLYNSFALDDVSKFEIAGFHLIPYETISGRGLLAVTLKGAVTISDELGNIKKVSCAAGITESNDSERAIFNPKILI